MKKRTRETWEEVKREKEWAKQKGYGTYFSNTDLMNKAVKIAEHLLKYPFILSVGVFGSTARGENGNDVDLLIVDNGTVSLQVLSSLKNIELVDSYADYAHTCYIAFAEHMPGADLLRKLRCPLYEYLLKEPWAIDLIFVHEKIRRDQAYLDEVVLKQSDPFFFRNIGQDALLYGGCKRGFLKVIGYPGFINHGVPGQKVLRQIKDEMLAEQATVKDLAATKQKQATVRADSVAEMITFAAIGGQAGAKAEVMSLSAALNNPERYQRWGTKPPRGICLYGPPGNGKTLLAKALAAETKVPFYLADASQIVSMWYGEAEKNVDRTFAKARETGGVLFFDEADSLASSREIPNAHEVTKRVVAALNRNMDGFNTSDRVVVFFATNRLEDMDSAVMRPGRIDRIIEVPLPNREGRRQVLAVHMKKAEQTAGRQLFEVDVESILEKTEEFSCADLAEIVRRALEGKVRKEDAGESPGPVTTEDVLAVIGSYERVKKSRPTIGFGEE